MLRAFANASFVVCAALSSVSVSLVDGCSSGVLPVGALGAPDSGASPSPSSSSTSPGGTDAAAMTDATAMTDASATRDSGHQDATTQDSAGSGDAGADAVPPTPISDGGLCTVAEEAQRWATMVREPIVPPQIGARLDLGWLNGPGITVQAAEQVNCQCQALGNIYGEPGITTCGWGDNDEVLFTYFPSNNTAWMVAINPGYTGGLGCNGNEPGDSPSGPCQPLQSRDKMHTYIIGIGSQVQKDNGNFEIDWLDPVNGPAELNELGDALFATYAPQLPAHPACLGDGSCVRGAFGDVPYFGVVPLGIYMMPASQSAAQPVPSIMESFQLYSPTDPTDGGPPQL
jgi:hypothetical protein